MLQHIKRWLEDVMAHLKLDKLRYSSKGCTEKFYNVWQPFMGYFCEELSMSAPDNPDV